VDFIAEMHVKRDVALRDFFKKNERFAAIVNAILFHGEKIVIPEHVYELDSNEASVIDKTIDHNKQDNKERDVVRKVWINNGYVIIALENQHESKKNMAARCGNYDMLRYLNQFENKDAVYGVITITLFTGEDRWQNPKTLIGAIKVIPEEVKDYIQDYKAYIEDIKDIIADEVDEVDARRLVEGIQGVYAMKKGNVKDMDYLSMSQEVAIYVASVTGFEELLDKVKEAQEGEMIHMCDALDNLRNDYLNEGKELGMQEGKELGKAQEQKKIAITMFKDGLSVEIIAKYLSLTKEQIEAYIEPIPAV